MPPQRKGRVSRRSFLRGASYGLAGAIFAGAYGDYDGHTVQVESVELKLRRWKADGLKVGYITDIHVNDSDEMARARHASELLAAAKPDLILFGGDCINSTHAYGNINLSLEPLDDLTCPKLAVLGNHDYASADVEKVSDALVESGFTVLKNRVMRFDDYNIAGYDDQCCGHRDPDFQPREDNTIALLHEPDFNDNIPDSIALQLSGHSHGGQICLPFGIPLYSTYMAKKYQRGYYPEAKVPLYVSRGVGTTGFKWRMFCPPEVTLLTLRSSG